MQPRKAATLLLAWPMVWLGVAAAQDVPADRDREVQRDPEARPIERKPMADSPRWSEPAERVQKASDLIGKDVRDTRGTKCGDLDDLIVDAETGRIIYAVVKSDGKQCLMPTAALELTSDAKHFVASCDRDQLTKHTIDKNTDLAERNRAVIVYRHYGLAPYWDNPDPDTAADAMIVWYRPATKCQRASDLMGKEVKNPENEKLGKIENLAVDPDAGRVIYGVLSFGGFLGIGDKLFAVPLSSLKLSDDNKQFVLAVEKERLKNAAGFDKDHWPDMANPRWATDTSAYYGQQPYWQPPDAMEPSKKDQPKTSPDSP